ncbi:MAG: nitrous oxide reductase family maturation protein NosD [Melioribacteraceae bacterium]|nr:MAG: nitrous oxide reductase family maturation protein NosD [Melioribacteraceae bacterium]
MLHRNGIKIFIMAVLFFTAAQITADVLKVGINQKYKLISGALTAALPGDTLIIKSGTYKEENLIIDKPVSIIGENFPVIDGEDKYEIFTVTSDNVFITGLKFINSGLSFINDNAAIKLDEVKNCVITNNKFEKNFFAIYLAKSSVCEISNNQITAVKTSEATSGNGIHLWYCRNIYIKDNYINGHRDGIYFEFVQSSLITGNKSENNLRYGLHFMFSDSCSYSKNIFKHNGAGVAVMFTHNVEMIENRFENNWGAASYGILLKDISDSKIENNYFYKNSSGIYIEGSNRVSVSQNEFIENGWAIRLMANSMNNNFSKNNFVGNSFDVATNSTKNYNTFINNFWSEYSGYDLNKDGFGDVPYRPVKLFSLIVERNRPTLILLRSMFVGILDAAEKIFPALTPETLIDNSPSMKRFL